jgi:hypothetical protein
MKEKTLKRIEEAFVEAFREAAMPLSREAQEFVRWLVANRRFRGLAASPNFAGQFVANTMIAQLLLEYRKAPEPTPEKLQEVLARIPGLVYGLRSDLFQKAVKQMAAGLPRKRAGGPKPRLATPAEKSQACAQIAALVGQEVKLSQAIARVARAARGGEGVSCRTMQRVWHRRPY